RGLISINEAEALHAHNVSEALRRAGILDYRSNLDARQMVEKARLSPYMEGAAQLAARRLFNAPALAERATIPLRHPGDLGALFGTAEEAPGQRTPEGRDD